MATIQSKKELIYNSRNGKQGTVRVEISNWQYDVKNKMYKAIVNDYLVEQITEDEISFEKLTQIESEPKVYPKAEIDALFYALQNPIEITESYTEEMDYLISQALLYVTQQDPIYSSEASDWEIYEAPIVQPIQPKP